MQWGIVFFLSLCCCVVWFCGACCLGVLAEVRQWSVSVKRVFVYVLSLRDNCGRRLLARVSFKAVILSAMLFLG